MLSVVRIDRVLDVIDRNARDITRVLPAIFGDADKQDDSWACRGATLASFCNWAGRPVRGKMHCRMHGGAAGSAHRAAISTR